MKKLAALAIVILVICGTALWMLAPDAFNQFIKEQIEKIGSETTQQTVKVADVDFTLTQGNAAIKGLTISNPKTYQQPYAFTLGNIALDVDVASLAKEPVVIESFTIHDAKAFVEFTKSGNANIKDILDAINKKLPQDQQPQIKDEEQKEPKVRVDKLILAGVGLTLDLRQLSNKTFTGKSYQETLPTVDLGNLGGKDGMPVSLLGKEIGKKIIQSIWQQAKSSQKDKLRAELTKKLKDKADKLKQKAKDKGKKLKEKYKDKAKEKLGGLLNKLGN